MLINKLFCSVAVVLFFAHSAQAQESNAFFLKSALPGWLKPTRLEDIAEKMEQKLEWNLQKVPLNFHSTAPSFFAALQVPNSQVIAFTKRSDMSIHMGPTVNADNVAQVLMHELTHVILMQKYKKNIPDWVEEGLANQAAGLTQIPYAWLARQKQVSVKEFSHPLKATTSDALRFYYVGSTALAVMLKEKCGGMEEFLNLSLKGGLEAHLQTYCGLDDLDRAFWKWVVSKKH